MTTFKNARSLIVALLATGFLLVGSVTAASSSLFFSEYVEGSSNNKALELFNPTDSPVTLTDTYSIKLFANGSSTPTATIPLTGSIAGGDTFVLARSTADPEILGAADQTTTNFLFNGDDAIALTREGIAVDVIGQIGFDPGLAWGSGDLSTQDSTLRRKAAVSTGDPDGSDPFDPSSQWDGFPVDTFDGLGSHDGSVVGSADDPCEASPTIRGTPSTDVLLGTPGADVIHADEGRDLILGRGGDDQICAGGGSDIVLGGNGDDVIDAGRGSDLVAGGDGDDAIYGGRGRDRLFGGRGSDGLDGGDEFDWCRGGPDSDTLSNCEWHSGL